MTNGAEANTGTSIKDSLAKLENVEKIITELMEHLSNCLGELAKDKPVGRQVESQTHAYRLALQKIESEMNFYINYLNKISTGIPYEGSLYSESIDLDLMVEKLQICVNNLSLNNQ